MRMIFHSSLKQLFNIIFNNFKVVPVELNSLECSPSISPQPPPIFKSNKVTPMDESNSDDQDGIVNDICETIDEAMLSIEEAEMSDEGSKDSGHTDESSITGIYDLQNEHEKVMRAETKESFKSKRSAHWNDNT